MKAHIDLIPTVYGMGCAGLGCGGGLGQDYVDNSYDGSAGSIPVTNTTYNLTSLTDAWGTDLTDVWDSITSGGSGGSQGSDGGISPNGISVGSGPINTVNGTTSGTSTSASTAQVTSAIASISNAFTSIFKAIQPLPAGCTQVQNAYGTSTQCVNAATTQAALSLSSLTSSSSLLYIGLGVGALLLFMSMSKK